MKKLAQKMNKVMMAWVHGKITDDEATHALQELRIKFELLRVKNATSR